MTHSAELRAIERNQELFMCDALNRLSKRGCLKEGGGGGLRGSGHTQPETWTCPAWLKSVNQETSNTMGAGLTWTGKENAAKDPV